MTDVHEENGLCTQANVRVFDNPDFGSIRTADVDGELYFIARDVTTILQYSNGRKAIIDHVDDEDKIKGVPIRDSRGIDQTPVLINESGLYSLILSSKLPHAKQFKKWVTKEVLPTIRKTGAYVANGSDEQRYVESLKNDIKILNESVSQLQAQVIALTAPKPLNMTVINTWKKEVALPVVEKISSDSSITYPQSISLICKRMSEMYGFNESVIHAEYKSAHKDDDETTITLIAGNELLRAQFIQAAISLTNEVMPVPQSTKDDNISDETHTCDQQVEARISCSDEVDFAVNLVAKKMGDNSKNKNKTRTKIYSRMATNRQWAYAMTRGHCTTKKDVIEKNAKYRKLFADVCNLMLSEELSAG